MKRVRVVLGDTSREVLEAVRDLIEEKCEVVAMGQDGPAVRALVETHLPDVLVTDVSLPHKSGIELARDLKAHGWNICVIFLTLDLEPAVLEAGWAAGAAAFVLKTSASTELIRAIQNAIGA